MTENDPPIIRFGNKILMYVLETERLKLRWLSADDAPFILQLVNDSSWLRYIGDRGVRTIEDARKYIENGPIEMYGRLGFGLYLVELKESGASIGMCGLLKRATLEDVDIGFALLPDYRNRGYAFESAAAVMAYGRAHFGFSRILAIASQDNSSSGKLLGKLGFSFERLIRLSPDAPELILYANMAVG